MGRTEIVKARRTALEALNDRDLMAAITDYFSANHTMKGEKAIKDRAARLLAELDEGVIEGVTSEVRNDILEEFASLSVKEAKIENNQIVSERKKKKDEAGLEDVAGIRAIGLPLELKDEQPTKANGTKTTYEMPVTVDGEGTIRTEDGSKIGNLSDGFITNHGTVFGMAATLVVDDYSGGKFRNLSTSLIIDLCQETDQVVKAA